MVELFPSSVNGIYGSWASFLLLNTLDCLARIVANIEVRLVISNGRSHHRSKFNFDIMIDISLLGTTLHGY